MSTMARWEPDARGRFLRAAIELFTEQGYDQTTVAQIAGRAGLTKTTFFRHFPDKREVLFFGQPVLVQLAAEAVAAAPADAGPLEAVGAGVSAMASAHTDEQREYGSQLQAVVAATNELRERALFKHASIADAIAGALRGRGVTEPAAGIAGELGARAYHLGFDRWLEASNTRPLPELAQEALDEFRKAVAALL